MKKLFLVDAYAIIYRCYYAFLGRPMHNSAGLNTSAVFGFVKYLRDIIRREKPHYLGVVFDSKGATFRHELFNEYKANRQATPEDIHLSVPPIKEILDALRIPVLEMCGWEADDIIGTLSTKAADQGFEVYMVTPDKDFGQLVGPHAYIYKQRKNGEGVEIIGEEQIKEHYGIPDPKLVVDILALWGDASDNIPGVPGIGEKTAMKLVGEFGTVEQILENADQLKGKQKENILASKDVMMLSKQLATIDTDVPVEFDPDALIMKEPDDQALRDVFYRMGFNMFIKEIDAGATALQWLSGRTSGQAVNGKSSANAGAAAASVKANSDGQGDLFLEIAQPASPAAPPSVGAQRDLFSRENNEGSGQGDLFAAEGYDNISTVEHNYRTVRTTQELEKLIGEISRYPEFCFDTETSGFDAISDRLVGLSFAVRPFEAWYVPFDYGRAEEYAALLKPLFENDKIAKTGQNLKFDIMVLRQLGIETKGFMYDTMLLHYLLDPESRHGMNHLARAYLNYNPVEIESLIGRGVKQITMDMVPVDKVAEYAAEDADVTLRLKETLWPQLIEQDLEKLYREIEEPMIEVLANMELTGVRIDVDILSESGSELNARLSDLENQIREMSGEPGLNVNSAKQLGDALFGKMKIAPNPKRTKTRQYRTDEEYLQSLSEGNPIIELILEYRGIKKLLSTYIDALPQLINPKTGRVHTSFNQAVTSTGRLSSSNPNLQNIPIRDARGREIRKAFVPADDRYLLFSSDYSQVELRLMAHLSGDKNLLDAFRNKEDIHSSTASLLFNVPIGEVTQEQRRRAKTANFGIIYGISAFGLSQRLNIPRGEAKEIIDGYFRSYPGVKNYMDNVIGQAGRDGYVSTIFGRKRFLKDIKSGNATVRGLAERNAINAPIQGSAADIMKIAMIEVFGEFAKRGLQSKLILQVHDELVVDMHKSEEKQVIEIVVKAMENAVKLEIPLTADYGVGVNWLAAH